MVATAFQGYVYELQKCIDWIRFFVDYDFGPAPATFEIFLCKSKPRNKNFQTKLNFHIETFYLHEISN